MNFSHIKIQIASVMILAVLVFPLAGFAQTGQTYHVTQPTQDSQSNVNTVNSASSPLPNSSGGGGRAGATVNSGSSATVPSGFEQVTPVSGVQQTTPTSGFEQGSANQTGSSNNDVAKLVNPLKGINSVSDLILAFMKIISYLAVIFGVIMLMWVGLQFVLARGNPEEITKRSNQLLWIVIGIGVILGARILIDVIINTLQATGTVNPAIIQSAHNAANSQ